MIATYTLVLTFDVGSVVVIGEVYEMKYEYDRFEITHGCDLGITSHPICRIKNFSMI